MVTPAFRAVILEAVQEIEWIAEREKMEKTIRVLLKSLRVVVVETEREEYTDSKEGAFDPVKSLPRDTSNPLTELIEFRNDV